MNTVTIIGRITKMELSKSNDNYSILNFSIADNKTAKQTGKNQFFNCVIFRSGAETLANLAKVGDRIAVSGSMQWQDWKKTTTTLSILKILVDRFELCGAAPQKEQFEEPFPKDFNI